MATFTPLTKEIDIIPSTTAAGGGPMPTGETLTGVTLGLRLDGTGAAGTYPNLVVVPAPFTVETKAALLAALGASFPPGNYWLAGQQVDTQAGVTFTSAWGAEVPVAILPPGQAPAPPVVSVS